MLTARVRSTKAGALAPATRHELLRHLRHAARSTKAGALAPATLGLGCGAIPDEARSTKAGALAPATRHHNPPMEAVGTCAQRRPER